MSAEGRAQAQALAAALSGERFDRAYSSDLQRARETAAIVLGGDVAVTVDERLREFDFGAWEGLTWDEIVDRFPESAGNAYTDARQYHPPGGERFEDVVARTASFLGDLERIDAGSAIVFTHAGVLHAVLAAVADRLEGVDPLGISFATASVTRLAMDARRVRIMTLNDVPYLNNARRP